MAWPPNPEYFCSQVVPFVEATIPGPLPAAKQVPGVGQLTPLNVLLVSVLGTAFVCWLVHVLPEGESVTMAPKSPTAKHRSTTEKGGRLPSKPAWQLTPFKRRSLPIVSPAETEDQLTPPLPLTNTSFAFVPPTLPTATQVAAPRETQLTLFRVT
jgi:hypothetical protein